MEFVDGEWSLKGRKVCVLNRWQIVSKARKTENERKQGNRCKRLHPTRSSVVQMSHVIKDITGAVLVLVGDVGQLSSVNLAQAATWR